MTVTMSCKNFFESTWIKNSRVFLNMSSSLFFPLKEPTSYDYDALISESGELTPKYFAFKKVIKEFTLDDEEADEEVLSQSTGAKSYGTVDMKFVCTIFDGETYV